MSRTRAVTSFGLVVALVLAAGACGRDEPDLQTIAPEPAAAPADLAQVADTVDAVTSYRSQVWVSMSFDGGDESLRLEAGDRPIGSIEVAGTRQAVEVRLGDLVAQAADQFDLGDTVDLTTMLGDRVDEMRSEMVVDGSALYLRQNTTAVLGDLLGETPDVPGDLGAFLAGEWVRVDAAALGLDPQQLAAQQASLGLTFDILAALLRSGGFDIEDRGTGQVRGQAVHGYATTATLRQLAEAGGAVDVDRLLGSLRTGPGVDRSDVDAALDTPVDLLMWVDDEQRPVRIEIAYSMPLPEVPAGGAADLWVAQEFFDFDDPSIVVEVPAGAVDLTDEASWVFGN